MRDVSIFILVLLCLGLFADFIDERAERYELRRDLDNATQALIKRDLPAHAAGPGVKPSTRRAWP